VYFKTFWMDRDDIWYVNRCCVGKMEVEIDCAPPLATFLDTAVELLVSVCFFSLTLEIVLVADRF